MRLAPFSAHYMLDGVPYFFLDMKDVLAGYNEVDVLVIEIRQRKENSVHYGSRPCCI